MPLTMHLFAISLSPVRLLIPRVIMPVLLNVRSVMADVAGTVIRSRANADNCGHSVRFVIQYDRQSLCARADSVSMSRK